MLLQPERSEDRSGTDVSVPSTACMRGSFVATCETIHITAFLGSLRTRCPQQARFTISTEPRRRDFPWCDCERNYYPSLTLNVDVSSDRDHLRQNDWVPRDADTTTAAPAWAERAMNTFGMSKIRTEVMRYLSQHPLGATSGQIARDLGATPMTVFRHLQDLESQQIVVADADTVRHGQRVIYRLDVEARDKALADYAKYLDGT